MIARWLRSKKWNVLPVYEKEIQSEDRKGPALYQASGPSLVAPDMLIFQNAGKIRWVEAKRKSAFSWHRNTKAWVTGINQRHYEDYLRVASISGLPLWLLFLQENGTAKDTPDGLTSPTGLYGNPINLLVSCEHHRANSRPGNVPMVYWSEQNLRKLACLVELADCA